MSYLAFLKGGSSDYPLELLRRAGVDLATPAPIEATMRRFERLLTERADWRRKRRPPPGSTPQDAP